MNKGFLNKHDVNVNIDELNTTVSSGDSLHVPSSSMLHDDVNTIGEQELIDPGKNECKWPSIEKKTQNFFFEKIRRRGTKGRIKKPNTAVKEEDGSSSLLFSKVDEKEKTKEHKCERCGHENSSQGRPGRGQDKNWKPWKKKDGDQDLSQIRCYKCKELGHYKGEYIDTLQQGQQLKGWDYLVSSNRIFSLKFFGFGTTLSPYLGVFYNGKYNDGYNDYNSNKIRYRCPDDDLRFYSDKNGNKIRHCYPYDYRNSAVWVANRNNPIPDAYGNLVIDVHGKLSLLSREGTVLDLFSPTLVKRNASVTLLDSGNLVLQELFPDGSQKKVLWQSFDYPTDTLLPGMKLGINHKTGHRWSLTSWRSEQVPAKGSFTLTGDLNGTDQMVILRQGNTHWLSGPWQNGQFKNTDLESSGSDVRLDYVSNETEQSFTYLTRTYDSLPALRMCMDGRLMGTTLNLDVQCHLINDPPGCAEDEFEKINCRKDYYLTSNAYHDYHYTYVNEYVYDESYNLTLYDCKKICWSNCSCVACTYATKNKAGCKTYAQKTYKIVYTQEEYYTIEYRGGKALKTKKLLLHHIRRFYNYSMSSATSNFSSTNKLGEGGFGAVYKLFIKGYPIISGLEYGPQYSNDHV
ncbi:hypothetical protein CTI12_AA482180 [Artemisia annua]|uniref:Bulb-type lectin domain-containing protein n=1 Tax=Artemisia annua TaxID=35608 RepID=A0A2U1LK65_ARTAN|nr:hypothetical protein CTI12_AA482180 [Artemisia annua]